MRLLICAGGTGGGVYPALSILQAIRSADLPNSAHLTGELEVLWVGSEKGMEADLVKREAISFQSVPAAGVHGVGLKTLPGNLFLLAQGVLASLRILRRFRPDALLFTGGFVAVPMAVASRFLVGKTKRPRSLVYVPDIEPGLALRVIARLADHIAVTVEDSRSFFRYHSQVSVTGYPLRTVLKPQDRIQARLALGLQLDKPVFLVLGGSKGARSINRALVQALPELLPEMQVMHISGQLDWAEMDQFRQTLLHSEVAVNYHLYAYLHEEMGAALSAADLVLSRAGASTLGELPQFSLPAILVPYPYAWRYQKVNASYLVEREAAILIRDADLPAQLLPVVRSLMRDGPRRLRMQQAMSQLAQPEAAQKLAGILLNLPDVLTQEGM